MLHCLMDCEAIEQVDLDAPASILVQRIVHLDLKVKPFVAGRRILVARLEAPRDAPIPVWAGSATELEAQRRKDADAAKRRAARAAAKPAAKSSALAAAPKPRAKAVPHPQARPRVRRQAAASSPAHVPERAGVLMDMESREGSEPPLECDRDEVDSFYAPTSPAKSDRDEDEVLDSDGDDLDVYEVGSELPGCVDLDMTLASLLGSQEKPQAEDDGLEWSESDLKDVFGDMPDFDEIDDASIPRAVVIAY